MKMIKFFFIMAIAITLAAASTMNEEKGLAFESQPLSPIVKSRFLAQYDPRTQLTCDKMPRVCRAKGSPGPDCCKKKCVNVMTDRLNCGLCGRKCTYTDSCCNGECVNTSFDKKNCGRCNNKCKKGNYCAYGLCSYA